MLYYDPNVLLTLVVRAIADGAAGRPLAKWALEEVEREAERRRKADEEMNRAIMGAGQ